MFINRQVTLIVVVITSIGSALKSRVALAAVLAYVLVVAVYVCLAAGLTFEFVIGGFVRPVLALALGVCAVLVAGLSAGPQAWSEERLARAPRTSGLPICSGCGDLKIKGQNLL
jgi:hypothetical protein